MRPETNYMKRSTKVMLRKRAVATQAPQLLHEGWLGGAGSTFLHLAAGKGKTSICAVLVEMGMDVDVPDPDNYGTPLESAAGGHLDTVKWLLKHGACPNGWPTSIATPLISAAVDGSVDIARALVDAGAEVNREHLRMPQTALDFAEAYKVKGSGQDTVADFLRERGGIQPYVDPHDWSKVPGGAYIQHIEQQIGSINPIRIKSQATEDCSFTVRKCAISPICHGRKRWSNEEYKLILTAGLSDSIGAELAMCLPWGWPLNTDSLKMPQFNWPVTLLTRLANAAKDDGLKLEHGFIIDIMHTALKEVEEVASVPQWVFVYHESLNIKRDSTVPDTLLLTPIVRKSPIPVSAGLSTADKKKSAKWKALAVPLDK